MSNKNHTGGPASGSIGSQVEGQHEGLGPDAGPPKGVDAPVSEVHPPLNGVEATGDLPAELNTDSGEL